MKKFFMGLVLSLQLINPVYANEAGSVPTDTQAIEAVHTVFKAVGELVHIMYQKSESTLSEAEKSAISQAMQIVLMMMNEYDAAVKAGDVNALSKESQEKLSKMSQQLMFTLLPFASATQDPVKRKFVEDRAELIGQFRMAAFEDLKKIVASVGNSAVA